MEKLSVPAPLDCKSNNLCQAWETFKEEVSLYIELVVPDEKEEEKRKKLLLYLLGHDGREIVKSLQLDETYKEVLEGLESYCKPKTNESFERYLFFKREKSNNEPFDNFLTDLRNLSATCNFGDLRDSLIRDQIVRTVDYPLRERLLREDSLTLKNCVQMCRAVELSKERNEVMSSEKQSDISASRVKFNREKWKEIQCKFCCKTHVRDKQKCPAFGKTCNQCGEENHFRLSNLCKKKSKQVQSVSLLKAKDKIFIKLVSENAVIKFQADTGASCNVISKGFDHRHNI